MLQSTNNICKEAFNVAARMMILRHKYKQDAKIKSLVCLVHYLDNNNNLQEYKCRLSPNNIFDIQLNEISIISCNINRYPESLSFDKECLQYDEITIFAISIINTLTIMLHNEYNITQDMDNNYFINMKVEQEI